MNVITRKAATFLSIVTAWIFYPVFFIFILIARLIRPAVHIRFIRFESGRVGHFAGNTEVYLCERDAGLHGRQIHDIFYYTPEMCNRQLKKMWERILPVSFIATHVLNRIKDKLPWYEEYSIWMKTDLDMNCLFSQTKPHLRFTPEEELKGAEDVVNLGIPPDAPFICLYARDAAYLGAVEPRKDWGYNDYRDSDINDYILAVKKMAERGYYAVRMGAIVKDSLKTNNPRIIDYANNGRNDFLDIYLSAKCHFFITSTGGLNAVPRIFRRRVAYADFIPLNAEHLFICTPDNLFIPKKVRSLADGRILSFREIVDIRAGYFYHSDDYTKNGLEIVNNTPEEIAALAEEMDDRIRGKWQLAKENELLQQRFWQIIGSDAHKRGGVRIGAEFLRKNRELLE